MALGIPNLTRDRTSSAITLSGDVSTSVVRSSSEIGACFTVPWYPPAPELKRLALPKGARLGAAPAWGSGQDRGGGRRRHVQVGVAAEALVVDGLGDRGMLAADRALGVA